MKENETEYCRYEFDPEIFEDREWQQNCCVRETLPDTNRCVWHADPDETDGKTVEALQEELTPRKNRKKKSGNVPVIVAYERRNRTELLDGAVLSGMDLRDRILFEDVSLCDADLTNSDLRDADLSDTDLMNVDLSDADISDANLSDMSLYHANLTDAKLHKANLSDAHLSGADLSGADLQDANLAGANLYRANISDAFFRGANLSDADLRVSDLSGADFTGADLSDANLSGLSGVNLSGINLSKVDLSGANLREVDLSHADVSGADFSGADLRDTNFTGTDIKETDFSGADLRDAFFSLPSTTATSWHQWGDLAQAYNTLASECIKQGLAPQALSLKVIERKARRKDAKARGNYFKAFSSWLAWQTTGDGIIAGKVFRNMILLFVLSTLGYLFLGTE
ncbi:MAG: pentapeptide repeat-containing protein [Halobacteriales archaeon]|nr:pentapeptide repeat-containing protein [Halobacteriales archaeon]